MATAGQVIKLALQDIIVQASEAPFEDDETQDAILWMNSFMTMLAAKGVNLGYTIVDNLVDEVTIPNGAIYGLQKNLAVALAPGYDAVVTPALRTEAERGLSAMYSLGVTRQNPRYPGTLPIGSGNEQDYSWDDPFYPELSEQILTEQLGPILLEEDTQSE